ncbi:Minor histocompatibility antigen H13 [Chelonia mydas]|uniref:Minor histocompatibility antigen H13 n=1 Tax=Chelonia mydas TaxID=8469 RepID=M7B7Y8_CHEMY|nr:Minor histocompatibility antigen H13 [Chelonia mydas]
MNASDMPETITSRDAARFPIVASCTLFGLYLFFKIFSQEYINLLLSMYFFVLGILALSHTISPVMNKLFPANFPSKQYQLLFTQGSGENKEEIVNYEFDSKDLVCLAMSSVVGVWYLLRKHWIANNLFGLAFSLNGVELLHLNNVSTGCILLGGLFIYDVFWILSGVVFLQFSWSYGCISSQFIEGQGSAENIFRTGSCCDYPFLARRKCDRLGHVSECFGARFLAWAEEAPGLIRIKSPLMNLLALRRQLLFSADSRTCGVACRPVALLVFGTNVMVTVAKSFEAPIKLVFPQDLLEKGLEADNFAMLGLGDVVIPGIFIALLLRFDISLKKNTHTYFYTSFVAYIFGLGLTIFIMHIFKHAQPALLYLVPACIGFPLLVALVKGEVTEMFSYEENSMPKEESGDSKDARMETDKKEK